MDSLIKRRQWICNPKYGLLGCVVIPYQVLFELLGPLFILLLCMCLICAVTDFKLWFEMLEFMKNFLFLSANASQSWMWYCAYLVVEIFLVCYAEHAESRKWYVFIIKIPEAVIATVFGILLAIPLSIARIWGMISFHWRRLVW